MTVESINDNALLNLPPSENGYAIKFVSLTKTLSENKKSSFKRKSCVTFNGDQV